MSVLNLYLKNWLRLVMTSAAGGKSLLDLATAWATISSQMCLMESRLLIGLYGWVGKLGLPTPGTLYSEN
jgi:hypothetical protein